MSDANTMCPIDPMRRRALFKTAAAFSALALLPLTRIAMAAPLRSRHVALGYWQGGSGLADFRNIRAGWNTPCARSAMYCEAALGDEIVDATAIASEAGAYRVRIVGAEVVAPVAIDVDRGIATHGLWRAWQQSGKIYYSSPVAMHWQADAGERLALSVRSADGLITRLDVPARRGVYVLAVSADASELQSWSQLALTAPDIARPLNLRLQARRGSSPHYVLLAVDREPAAATAV